MMNKVIYLLISVVFLCSCDNIKEDSSSNYNIIPRPNEIKHISGVFTLQGNTNISFIENEASNFIFNYLLDALKNTSITLNAVGENEDAPIKFIFDDSMDEEAYILDISSNSIIIKSNNKGAGLFYGVQSLIQLFPNDIYNTGNNKLSVLKVSNVYINDSPRFKYRGAMMDVARNFLSKETVFKFIDLMALYKLNHLHMHLTNDQGWRIEIKRYPKLTEIGSYRKQTQIGHSDYYWPRRYDNIEHGGFYTQDEIREIIKYASDRFITIVPEIEMPGHASAALASYPELSGGLEEEYVVRDYFDIFDEVFCPKETTFTFLENVLSEVIDLFPSHYIHIGGDECPKKSWKRCPHCQALIKKEGLKNEEQLQSWFIHRIEKFVNSKGRNIIGWDEILEGGLAPNATVMSWRGESGGISAAKQKHRVIMSPGYRCYFDFYQEDPEFASLAMGGFLPLDSVYDYDPLPSELTQEEQKYIIGVQANIWGEYIQTQDYFEYMTFPRLLAISEVQWTLPRLKNFKDFTYRLYNEFDRLDSYNVNYSRNFFNVNYNGKWNHNANQYEVTLSTFTPHGDIRYSINDSVVTHSSPLYTTPLLLDEDATIYAKVFMDDQLIGETTNKFFAVNFATGCEYINDPIPESVNFNNDYGLTDGYRAYPTTMHKWISYRRDTVVIDIDLKQERNISEVSLGALWRPWNYTWPPRAVKVSSLSNNTYSEITNEEFTYDFSSTEAVRFHVSLSFSKVPTRFVRIELISWGPCPEGYYRAGEQSRLAIDEIEIK